jgi:hypothetical protein
MLIQFVPQFSKEPACKQVTFTLVSFSVYFFYCEDGGDMFLRNVGWHSTDYTALYPRRWHSSNWLLFSRPHEPPVGRVSHIQNHWLSFTLLFVSWTSPVTPRMSMMFNSAATNTALESMLWPVSSKPDQRRNRSAVLWRPSPLRPVTGLLYHRSMMRVMTGEYGALMGWRSAVPVHNRSYMDSPGIELGLLSENSTANRRVVARPINLSVFSLHSCFEKNKMRLMGSRCCLCVRPSVCVSPLFFVRRLMRSPCCLCVPPLFVAYFPYFETRSPGKN